MQDKNNIANIDEQFTNLGWEKMQGVLDKEMPVEPVRKYRMGWLWWLLLLGILASGTYYNFVIKNTAPTNEIPDTTIANVIENTIDITTLETKSKTSDEAVPKDEILHSDKDIQAKEKVTISPKNIIKKEIVKNIIQDELHILNKNNFNKNNIKKDISFIEKKLKKNNIETITGTFEVPVIPFNKQKNTPTIFDKKQAENTQSPIATSTKNPSRSTLITTERIATLSPQISTSNNTIIKPLLDIDPIPKPRKFSQTYSLLSGVQSDEFRDFGGINTGLLAHYRFTTKFGLETGLTYTNTKKNIDTDVDYTERVNEEYPENMQQYSETVSDVLSLHYLRLPLSFTYRPHTKIQLYTGLNAGYRLSENSKASSDDLSQTNVSMYDAQSSDDTYQSSFNANITTNEEVDTYGIESTDRITIPYSFTIRRADLVAQGGFRYYPTPRLGIDISYQHGLVNMTKNTTTNRNSGLQLALVWQLHR